MLAVLGAFTLVVLAACGGDDDGGSSATPSPTPASSTAATTPASTPTATEGDNGNAGPPAQGVGLTAMLGALPDTPDVASTVAYVNLAAYFEAIGVGQPPRDATVEELAEWVDEMVTEGQARNAPLVGANDFAIGLYRQPVAYQTELGIQAAEVAETIRAGKAPETYTLLSGEFNAGNVNAAVASDPTWSDRLETATWNGVEYYTWGADLLFNQERITPVRPLGHGGRLALIDGLLLWCGWTDGMTGMIDSNAGTSTSLAERPDIGSVANIMVERDAYSLFLNTPDFEETPPSGSGPLVEPWLWVAEGGSIDEDGPVLTLVLGHTDEGSAAANVGRLQTLLDEGEDRNGTPWADQFGSVEITSEGTLTIATLRGDDLPWGGFASFGPTSLPFEAS